LIKTGQKTNFSSWLITFYHRKKGISTMRKLIFLTITAITFFILGCTSEELTSARLYIQQKNLVKAEEFLIKALKVEPENPEIPYLLGRHIYSQREDWDKMNEMFDRALSIDPEKVILLGGTVREYVEQNRYEHWSKKFNKGVASLKKYYEQGHKDGQITLKESIDLFETSIQIYPGEIQNYPILSRCYFEMGDSVRSIATVKKGAEISPDNFNINLTAGQILNNMNDKQGALPFLKHAVELEPHNSDAIQLLAQIYYDLGKQQDAIETYKIAIAEEEDKKVKADLHFNLGVIYNQMSEFDAAEEAFDEAYYLNDQDFEAVLGMAHAFEGLGDKYKNGTDGFEKDLTQAARWYRKAGRKIKDAMTIDYENEEKYTKQLELIQYKKNIVEGEQE
jgi:tetratricopeptide (TPR) repeat protein|tara:strand:- start:747 stop:1925 length:1179 start_codon:yes stop_codon:yes gene_type:complete